jgi:hypothetical protein
VQQASTAAILLEFSLLPLEVHWQAAQAEQPEYHHQVWILKVVQVQQLAVPSRRFFQKGGGLDSSANQLGFHLSLTAISVQ